jgi:hypothetical protein
MRSRGFWSILLIIIAVAVMALEPGLLGALIGSMILVSMLFLWTIPGGRFFDRGEPPDPSVKRVSQTLLGLGLGLIVAVAALILLPGRFASFLLMAIGAGFIVWWLVQRRG